MKSIYPAVLALWIMGYPTIALGVASTVFGFTKNCESISCQVEGVFWQTTGFFTMFIGAVLIVLGYAHKSKEDSKDINIL